MIATIVTATATTAMMNFVKEEKSSSRYYIQINRAIINANNAMTVRPL